jgi:oleate hydratase
MWFTVTLNSPEFFNWFENWSSNAPGCGGITTFKDSNWLMSIIIPHQPYFLNQPENVQVFWGYALSPERIGNIVRKPMVECTGQEIFAEILGLLGFSEHPRVEIAITIPCLMPYMTSQFLTRSSGDRPQVIPKGSTNLALLGQFVEIPRDVVGTVEYSVRTAQIAVFGMMGVDKKLKDICKVEHNFKALAHAVKKLLT